MAQGQVTITLPISAHALGAIGFFALVIILSVIVFVFTYRKEGEDWITQIQKKVRLSGLHPILAIFVILVWAALFFTLLAGVFWVLYGVLERSVAVTIEEGKVLRWYLLTLAAITAALGAVISFPFTLIRMQLNRRQTETAEQGLITDRINKAVEGLGAEKTVKRSGKEWTERNLEVRLGAIFSLERIAKEQITQDSYRDHLWIMEILCTYIRMNHPVKVEATTQPPATKLQDIPWPSVDISHIVNVVGRHKKEIHKNAHILAFRPDLREVNLQKCDFRDGIFDKCRFERSDLSFSRFYFTSLKNVDFRDTNITGSAFYCCNFTGSVNLAEEQVKSAYWDEKSAKTLKIRMSLPSENSSKANILHDFYNDWVDWLGNRTDRQ